MSGKNKTKRFVKMPNKREKRFEERQNLAQLDTKIRILVRELQTVGPRSEKGREIITNLKILRKRYLTNTISYLRMIRSTKQKHNESTESIDKEINNLRQRLDELKMNKEGI